MDLQTLESLAPDQESLKAAQKLLKPSLWSDLSKNNTILWGSCQGSGSTPYRITTDIQNFGSKCSCPSRKFPCKHALALVWKYCENSALFQNSDELPQWIVEWMGRRKGSTLGPQTSEKASLSTLVQEQEKELTPEEQAKKLAAEIKAKARNLAIKEEAMIAGFKEFQAWLLDLTQSGILSFMTSPHQSCSRISQRLVDAKASEIAIEIENFPQKLIRIPDSEKEEFTLKMIGRWHLISKSYLNRELWRVSQPMLESTLLQTIGWTLHKDDVINNPESLKLQGDWEVICNIRSTHSPKILKLETWIVSTNTSAGQIQLAVIRDFTPVSAASGFSLALAEKFAGEIVFYPGCTPLRALIQSKENSNKVSDLAEKAPSLEDAWKLYNKNRAQNPFISEWPILSGQSQLKKAENGEYWLCSEKIQLPLYPIEESAEFLKHLELNWTLILWDGQKARLVGAYCQALEQTWGTIS